MSDFTDISMYDPLDAVEYRVHIILEDDAFEYCYKSYTADSDPIVLWYNEEAITLTGSVIALNYVELKKFLYDLKERFLKCTRVVYTVTDISQSLLTEVDRRQINIHRPGKMGVLVLYTRKERAKPNVVDIVFYEGGILGDTIETNGEQRKVLSYVSSTYGEITHYCLYKG